MIGHLRQLKIFNEKGDIIRYESKEIDGDYIYSSIYTYDRTYDENGLPLKTVLSEETIRKYCKNRMWKHMVIESYPILP